MCSCKKTERRDPYSPVLKLGSVLSTARYTRNSGHVEIWDRGLCHTMGIHDGSISTVSIDNDLFEERSNGASLAKRAAQLFVLKRPHIIWTTTKKTQKEGVSVDPVNVVLSGVTARKDLFNPLDLVDRIPVQSLHIEPATIARLKKFSFSKSELHLLESLYVPTPVSIILWKRGLDPNHAGALIVALNVLGLWREKWAPGLLPRIKSVVNIMLHLEQGADDFELLGISPEHENGALERSFRQISFELHPDRLIGIPEDESALAETAFRTVSEAYERLKHSRRSRSVRHVDKTQIAKVNLKKIRVDNWRQLLAKAEEAARAGDSNTARIFALKALALSPPSSAKKILTEIVRCAA